MKWARALAVVVLGALLAGCTSNVVVQTVPVPGPTQIVTATPPSGSSDPATLVVCQDAEPETLYRYGGSATARNVLEAVYDGPIDYRSYDFQPVILERLPSLEEGDAYFTTVVVQEGDPVVDVSGWPVILEDGVQVFANHTCVDVADPECVVTYEGTPIQMEQMVVSWEILEGVTWSDGEPVTADDSVYSYQVACHADTPSSRLVDLALATGDLCDRTDSYVSAGERTVVWTGLPGYVEDLYFLNFFSPLPRHLWQEELRYSPADLLSRPESTRQPLGWGPFVITESVQGDHITLERNRNYFRADEGLPRVDRLVFRFADSVSDLTAMLLAGQCDIGLVWDGRLGGLGPPYAELSDVMPFLVASQEDGLLQLVTAPGDLWEHLVFGIDPASGYTEPEFFGDVRVRQAVAQCIDRQALVDEVTYGLGRIADVYVPSEHPLFAGEGLSTWTYDPRAGQALLAEVGWTDDDEDGVVEAHGVSGVRTGTPFQVQLLFVSDSRQEDAVARILRSNLADCGIQADLVTAPPEELLADGPLGPLMGRQFSLALFHWRIEDEPPCYLYLTEEIPGPEDWGRANLSGFSDETYDEACRQAVQALPRTPEYRRYHVEAQEIFSQQLPDLPLFWWVRVAVARPGVTGFVLDGSEESELWNVESLGLTP